MILRTAGCIYSTPRWTQWPAGRLIHLPIHLAPGHEDDPCHQRKVLYAMAGDLTDKDVVALALFRDKTFMGYGKSWVEPLPDFENTMALLREIGPSIRGVIVGNQDGVEVSYRYLYHGWQGDAIGNILACSDYVKNVGGMLRDMGVTPFFSPMDFDILQDCYLAEWRMKRALDEVGATAVVSCGYTMIPGAFVKECPIITGEVMQAHLEWSEGDCSGLGEYLRSGSFWSGLCGRDGIRGGNVETLTAAGFSGFATKLIEPWWLEALEQERGPRWWA
jgi:hypothetical protein